MIAPEDGDERQSCPCLYDDAAPLCRADVKALHVPTRAYIERVCGRPKYRQCTLYRAWLNTAGAASERHTADVAEPRGTTLAPLTREPAQSEEKARKEDLMAVLKKLIADERAQDLAEYGIAMTVIAAGVIAVAVAIVGNVMTLWTVASGIIAAAA